LFATSGRIAPLWSVTRPAQSGRMFTSRVRRLALVVGAVASAVSIVPTAWAAELVIAPTAATGAAGPVADRTATLSAGVGPNGAPTSYQFEYGTTTAYGRTTPPTPAGSGDGAVPAEATVAALTPATTYHFRIVATNSGGITRGDDKTFTTAVEAQVTPASAPLSTAPTPAFASVRLLSTRLGLSRRLIALSLSCPAATAGDCSGETKLTATRGQTATRVTLGRAAFSIPAGQQATVRLRVTRAGRRMVERVRRLRGRVTIAARIGTGEAGRTVTAVTIRRR
jgi:hypothetical protein